MQMRNLINEILVTFIYAINTVRLSDWQQGMLLSNNVNMQLDTNQMYVPIRPR